MRKKIFLCKLHRLKKNEKNTVNILNLTILIAYVKNQEQ